LAGAAGAATALAAGAAVALAGSAAKADAANRVAIKVAINFMIEFPFLVNVGISIPTYI
jgi:hypothetical protein